MLIGEEITMENFEELLEKDALGQKSFLMQMKLPRRN